MRQAVIRKGLCAAMLALVLMMCAHPGFADDSARAVKTRYTPTYPELAKKMHVGGVVRVQLVVAPNGQVKDTKVIGGHPVLVESALEAIRKWRYEPAPAETRETVEFKFDADRQ